MASEFQVVIIEYGSQTTDLIAREVRKQKVRPLVIGHEKAEAYLDEHPARLVILSGGMSSVYDSDAPQLPKNLFSLKYEGSPTIIFGICYGLQAMAKACGGKVEPDPQNREYGSAKIIADTRSPLFYNTPNEQPVWASHGDSVTELPPGFRKIAISGNGGIAAIANGANTRFGIQHHAEVTDTPYGSAMFANLLRLAGCVKDWEASSEISNAAEFVLRNVGTTAHASGGYSGGVDSSVALAITQQALGDRFHALTIDADHLREGELAEIIESGKLIGLRDHQLIDISHELDELMATTIDGPTKRHHFSTSYGGAFTGGILANNSKFLAQGTTRPDVIESGDTGGSVIKVHHNRGFKPPPGVELLNPIEHLYKDDIRALARELGLPERISARPPFPGPGAFLRVLWIFATRENRAVWRWGEAIKDQILADAGVSFSQSLCAYAGMPVTGIKGDLGVSAGMFFVRAVQTVDYMTAKGIHFPEPVMDNLVRELSKHPKIVRVMMDSTPKTPGTIEYE